MFIILLLLPAAWQSTKSPPLLGADEIMRRMAAARPKPAKVEPFARPKAESAALRTRLSTLSPGEAATGWIALMRDWEVAAKTISDPNETDRWAEVMMSALPEPAAWPLIRDKLGKLPPGAKRGAEIALFDDLLGRDADVLRYLESRRNPEADPQKEDVFSPDRKISDAEKPIALRAGRLDLLAKIYIREAYGDAFPYSEGLPDMVRQFGRDRAAPVVRQVLEAARTSFSDVNGVATQDLARSIVLTDLANLKSPQWALARGLGDFDFVQVQAAKFGEESLKNQGSSRSPDLIYGLGLAQRGQMDHAEQFLSSASSWYRNLGVFVHRDSDEQPLFDLVSKLLDRKPIEALWPLYEELGRSLGHMDAVAKRLADWQAAPGLELAQRLLCLEWKADLDCASGRTKQGIAEYEERIRLKYTRATGTLLQISQVVGDREALDFAVQAGKDRGSDESRLPLFAAYLRQGRTFEAQDAALKAAVDVHDVNLGAEGQGRLLNPYPDTGVKLAELYYLQNQPAEIITLLHEYPNWGTNDLFDVIDSRYDNYFEGRVPGTSLGYYAAWALAKTGQKQLATRVLRALIPFSLPGDVAFELLNQLEGAGAMELYETGPLDRGPLLWKGDLLLRLGKPKEAERSVRTAIALDPADAGAARGRRQFAYEILARILTAEHKDAEVEACQRVVKAARLEDLGDEYQSAGLYSLAAELYQRGLGIHPDDCLAQTRYAALMRLLGRNGEAVQAYQKALELLPNAQGPIDGVNPFEDNSFQSESDRKLARVTLEKLARGHPQDPGLLVATGEFESLTGNSDAALARYEEAVAVDPRYVRAWAAILQLAGKGMTSRKQAQDAMLATMRLAPLDPSYYYHGFEAFSDKSALWLAFRKASKSLRPLPRPPLYPLEASKRSLASGTYQMNLREIPAPYKSPGAALAGMIELQSLFP